ncbi:MULTISPECIES: hypothetical protein [unclassified Pseudomonas]|uniref:hypothetical protein n=1 Tax=unclassified Pseudomonas TaxID=196821 RepID=UPI0021C7AE36|nr:MULTISPECIES: hypothetical protein [unclassified Pseudomonas]MCU1731078.1 hypothetical protein [Pseudomonas sp. 20P_3.2_Bac4]MCU1743621.1 hypothetical protein [Pseudomonas sp. 20P_3.2_Bac5]
MRIVQDFRSDEILRLEHLLEGFNYTVWINTYGPFDLNRTIEEQLSHSIGKDVAIGGQSCVTANEARSEIAEQLLHPGDGGYGPIELEAKRSEILMLLELLLTRVNFDQASVVTSFRITKGHPAYPVFWEFSFDIHANGKRWILMGSSSD